MEECEYSLNGLCFNPAKLQRGILAMPCTECNCCQACAEPKTTIQSGNEQKITVAEEFYHYGHEELQTDLLHINQQQPEVAQE